jgi:hypothetical protein
MAFADPFQPTYSGATVSLFKVLDDGSKSVYQNDDKTLQATISHQTRGNGRTSSMVRIDQAKVAADPVSAVNKSVTCSVYFVIDHPEFGFSVGDVETLLACLGSVMINATTVKLLRGEH